MQIGLDDRFFSEALTKVDVLPQDVRRWKQMPQGRLWSPSGKETHLEGSYRGHSAFLIGSGPSLKGADLSPLQGRGLVTMCMNNSWVLLKPTHWVGVDPPGRFHSVGWLDPSITKFVPGTYVQAKIRLRQADGQFVDGPPVYKCPSTVFFARKNGFDPSVFFTEKGVAWGTLKGTTDVLGISQNRTVLLAAIKILYVMGIRNVFLLGVDFSMPEDLSVSPYAFEEDKDQKGRRYNNLMYRATSRRLDALRQEINASRLPFRVWNCNSNSLLKVFPHVPLSRALEVCTSHLRLEKDTKGWYSPEKKKAEVSGG